MFISMHYWVAFQCSLDSLMVLQFWLKLVTLVSVTDHQSDMFYQRKIDCFDDMANKFVNHGIIHKTKQADRQTLREKK